MSLIDEKKRWERELYDPLITKYPERKQKFSTSSGIDLPPVMLPLETQDYLEQLSFPGEYPFTRGVQPTLYRGRFWTMRQYAGYATAQESNARYRYLLDQGRPASRWLLTCRPRSVMTPMTRWLREKLEKLCVDFFGRRYGNFIQRYSFGQSFD